MGRSTGVSPVQRRTLDRLSRLPPLREYYLAGGTAIAAHLGHRRSLDLDLFSRKPGTDLESPRRAIINEFDNAAVVDASDVTVRMQVDGMPLDLVRYPYPLVGRTTLGPGEFPMAGLRDLAAMKLAAISRRGIRRDFWDLFAIVDTGRVTLANAARTYVTRFGVAESDVLRAVIVSA